MTVYSLSTSDDGNGRSPLLTGATLLFGLLAIVLLLAYRQSSAPPHNTAVPACAVPPATAAPVTSWRFQSDPADRGLVEGWFTIDFDAGGWDRSAPGAPWEERGYLGLDGVAWYRAVFNIPAAWDTAYLGTVGVDDTARLWVNGKEKPLQTIVPLPTGQRVHIVYRIRDEGGFGGLKKSVKVGATPRAALPADDLVRRLAQSHPEWPMPAWVSGGYHAWTFSGAPGAEEEAIISAETAVAPWADAPLAEIWLRDAGGQLHTPQTTFSLVDGVLPMPQAAGTLADLTFETLLFADFAGEGTYWQTTLRNETTVARQATVYVPVRPLSVAADLRPIHTAGFAPNGDLWLNGELFANVAPRPVQVATGTWTEIMADIQEGRLSGRASLECAPRGDGMAVMAYPLTLAPGETWDLTLTFPAAPGEAAPSPRRINRARNATRHAWQGQIGSPHITVPDDFVMDAYQASIGYLLIALDENGPHPGPLEHDALWVRDAAFIGETLLSLGYYETVADYIPFLFAYQREDGYAPAIIEPGRGPRPDVEWDAQGQLIFLIAEYYRYTGDRERVAAWYPHARAAAEFLAQLRAETADNPPPTRGILPPSKSAEDLGPEEWRHYWDDFWAVAGLENGAYLAAELGRTEEAHWMAAEADGLRRDLRASIEAVMGAEPAYIPNGPEDVTSSAMARGTANSLYPVEVFPREDPLIIRSFDVYYEKWIAPQNGGYKHIYGQWWPYGGLGLARDYLRLGRHNVLHQILGWTLQHQTLPGAFAWAEQVNPATKGFSGGDMPHAWAASSYVTLLREMLLMRDGQALELFAGVPGSWLEAGEVVGVYDAPTPFGPLTAVTDSTLTITPEQWQGALTVTVDGATPPDGFRWRLPRLPQRIDGPPGTELADGWLLLPPDGGEVTLTYGE